MNNAAQSYITPVKTVTLTNGQTMEAGKVYPANDRGHKSLTAAEKYAASTARLLTKSTGVEFIPSARLLDCKGQRVKGREDTRVCSP